MTFENIQSTLSDIVKSIINCELEDKSASLLDMMEPYNLLYMVQPIEEKFGIDIAEIIKDADYNIMSINNLAKKISEIIND